MKDKQSKGDPAVGGVLSLSKLKEELMSLFREERVVPERPREILLYCEWQMPPMRKYSDYEAAILTPKMEEIWRKKSQVLKEMI